MKLYEIIQEARRNPTQNPKQNGMGAALNYLDRISRNINLDQVGVSMTAIPKLGLNPQSEYNTPIGVYFYPATYFMEKGGQVEFQADAPYIQIFQMKACNIISIDDVDVNEYNGYIGVLYNKVDEISKLINISRNNTMKIISNAVTSASTQANVKTYGGMFWYVLYSISNPVIPKSSDEKYADHVKKMYGNDDTDDYELSEARQQAKRSSVVWNKLLRMLEIDVVVDYGSSVLHMNEPTQGVVLDTTVIEMLNTIDNKEVSTNDDIAFKKQTKGLRSIPFINEPADGKFQFAVKMDVMGVGKPLIYKVYANNETTAKRLGIAHGQRTEGIMHTWIKRADVYKV